MRAHFRGWSSSSQSHPITVQPEMIEKNSSELFVEAKMDGRQVGRAREMLRLSQRQLGVALGWTGAKQVSNLETGVRPVQVQTALAIECLLRRAGLWTDFARHND